MAAHSLIVLAFFNVTCSDSRLPLILGMLIRLYECLADWITAAYKDGAGKALIIPVVKTAARAAFFDFGNHRLTSCTFDLTKITRNEESVWEKCFMKRCANLHRLQICTS